MGGAISYLFYGSQDDTVVDPATGLTKRDKDNITRTWAIIADRKNVKKNGVEFFIQLFEAYPYMQDYFPLFKNKKLTDLRTDIKMRAHATSVMYSLSSFIENLDDPETLVGLIEKMAKSHLGRGIEVKEFDNLKKMFGPFLTTVLGSQCTPEVKESWDKLLTTHNAVVKQTEEGQKGNSTT